MHLVGPLCAAMYPTSIRRRLFFGMKHCVGSTRSTPMYRTIASTPLSCTTRIWQEGSTKVCLLYDCVPREKDHRSAYCLKQRKEQIIFHERPYTYFRLLFFTLLTIVFNIRCFSKKLKLFLRFILIGISFIVLHFLFYLLFNFYVCAIFSLRCTTI